MIIHDMEQGTPEWHQIRLGLPTASCFDKILTPTGKSSTQSDGYLYELVAEKLSGRAEEGFSNGWTERGKEVESEARELFRLVTDIELHERGFITTDDGKLGCSPDAVILDADGEVISGAEFKCPMGKTQIKYLLGGKCPTEYLSQVQGSMYVTGAAEWWFCSYYPGLDPLIVRVPRDDDWIGAFDKEIAKFQKKLAEALAKLQTERQAA